MVNRAAERTKGIQPSKIREVTSKVQELVNSGIAITDLSIGRPDFDTPVHIKEAAKKALDMGQVHYTASPGTLKFREAVCYRLMQDYKLKIEPDKVIATIGAAEGIYAAFQGILNPGDEVLIPEPAYVYYGGWSYLAGAKVVYFPAGEDEEFVPKVENIEKYITPKSRVLVLTSPHNPTGQVVGREDLAGIAELAVKHDLIVIADDIYSRILYDDVEYMPIAAMPGMRERTIIVGSFSKTYAMDGWRAGYLVVPREMSEGIQKMHQHIVSCPNTFVQAGAQAALTGPQDCVDEMVKEFDRRRRLIMSYLDDIKIPYIRPKGAFYVFPNIRQFGLSSKEMSLYLLNEARLATVPGDAFGALGEGHIRMSFSTAYNSIDEGMERTTPALRKLPRKNF